MPGVEPGSYVVKYDANTVPHNRIHNIPIKKKGPGTIYQRWPGTQDDRPNVRTTQAQTALSLLYVSEPVMNGVIMYRHVPTPIPLLLSIRWELLPTGVAVFRLLTPIYSMDRSSSWGRHSGDFLLVLIIPFHAFQSWRSNPAVASPFIILVCGLKNKGLHTGYLMSEV